MTFFARLFGRKPQGGHARMHTQQGAAQGDHNSTRRELLRVVVRDTLTRHGLPQAWITAEMLAATSRGREPGLHLRLQVRHWDPRLQHCLVAFQKHVQHRIELYDPLATQWLMGISWQYTLTDDGACPEMPDPAVWKSPAPQVPALQPAAVAAVAIAAAAAPVPAAPAAKPKVDRRAELEKMFAQQDAKAGPRKADFGKTQPLSYHPTEPAGL